MLNIAIIGGGAAGFFAAIEAKRQAHEATVTIFERAKKVLAKVEVSGGGRCNLTNSFAAVTDLKNVYPRGHRLMKRLFNTFDYQDAYQWFELRGVPLVVQEDDCVFPVSQRSQSIVRCLVREAQTLGVQVLTSHAVEAILPQPDSRLALHFKGHSPQYFHCVLVATGGSPRIEGLKYLADIGHRIVPPVPSLFTFNLSDKAFKHMMGTVISPVTASISGTKFRAEGALLITHWGASGPVILKLSSLAARYIHEQHYHFPLAMNWIHESNAARVEEQMTALAAQNGKRKLATVRPYGLTGRVWEHLLQRAGMPTDKRWSEIGRKGLHQLIEVLTNDVYDVSGRGSFREEFVTCGGIDLADVNPRSLESKVCPHLFFAGEVLDIDAVTGGFNLQAAWTTGFVAGRSMTETFTKDT